MVLHKEKEQVSANDVLQALADGDEINLSRCVITDNLDVNRLLDPTEEFQTEKLTTQIEQDRRILTFTQPIVFDNCTFDENVVFAGPWSQPESIAVEFKRNVMFNSSLFNGQTRFRNAIFCETAGFDGCTLNGVATFRNAVFAADAKFRTTVFSGYCLFANAEFRGSVSFTNSHFVKGVNFSSTRFLGSTDFGGVYSSSRAVPAYDAVFFARRRFGGDESFWRFVKQSTQEAGYYQLAGECFYNERCGHLCQKFLGADYDSLSQTKKLVRLLSGARLLPELIFGRLLFGYGERPVRVLAAGAIIIFACALFYSLPGALIGRQEMTEHAFFRGLYFSTITFTTLGYGDLYPSVHGFCRQLAMVEAMAGGCLMALFVVCLAKRYSRG